MMRLVGRIVQGDGVVVGELDGEDLHIIGSSDEFIACLRAPQPDGVVKPVSAVEFAPPLESGARVLAVALNYQGHADETRNATPERPLFFYKPPSSFVGHGGTLDPHREVSGQFDYEGEVGVVIGRRCTRVSADEALDHVLGIVALNDGSARDRLKIAGADGFMLDWLASKAMDRSSAIGPLIAVGEEVIAGLRDRTITVRTRVNGEVVQSAGIDQLVFPVEDLVSVASHHMTLEPGDVIATGTPDGVGAARGEYLQKGDRLTIDVTFVPPLEVEVG